MRENIIIGDIHGCRDEFNELLDKLKYNPEKHRIILVGDLLDRGPDPVGLVKQIRKMGLECVLANHEEKCLRWHKHEAVRALTNKKNPIEVKDDRKEEWEALSKKDLIWLFELPLKINIKDNWHVVHAGMEPGISFSSQNLERIIRIRYVDEAGRYVKMKTREPPPGTWFWAERWNQPYNIIFGHQVFHKPMVFKNSNNTCIAIDTGCCFGGQLTAYNVERDEFVQVQAKKVYYKKPIKS